MGAVRNWKSVHYFLVLFVSDRPCPVSGLPEESFVGSSGCFQRCFQQSLAVGTPDVSVNGGSWKNVTFFLRKGLRVLGRVCLAPWIHVHFLRRSGLEFCRRFSYCSPLLNGEVRTVDAAIQSPVALENWTVPLRACGHVCCSHLQTHNQSVVCSGLSVRAAVLRDWRREAAASLCGHGLLA